MKSLALSTPRTEFFFHLLGQLVNRLSVGNITNVIGAFPDFRKFLSGTGKLSLVYIDQNNASSFLQEILRKTLPIPIAAPVTRATLPFKSFMIFLRSDMPAFAALRESTPSRQAQGELTLVPQLRDYSISMAVAMETPPPPHRVARPSVFLRFFIAWMSVTMIRLPVAPTG